MTLNGIYWTAIVFGESFGQVAVSGLATTSPYQRAVGTVNVSGTAMPPRVANGTVLVSAQASGQDASGPGYAIGTVQVTGYAAPFVSATGVVTVSASATGLSSIYGARRNILLPNRGNLVYPLLQPIRTAFQGGKTPTRPTVDEHGDPGSGAKTQIWIPRPEHPTYPLFPQFRLSMHKIARMSDVVGYDSVGAGVTGHTTSWSENHTIGAQSTALLLHVTYLWTGTVGTLSFTAGGVTMNLLGSILFLNNVSSFSQAIAIYGLLNPPTGLQSISANSSSGSFYLAMNSVAYTNVSGFGAAVTNNANSSSLTSGAVTAQSPQMIAQSFAIDGSIATRMISGYSGTTRSSIPAVSGSNAAIVIGDTPGNAGVNLAATGSAADYWGSVTVPLLTAR